MAITATTLSHHPAGSLLHLELEALPVVLPPLYQTLMDLMVVVNPKHLQATHSLLLTTDHLRDDTTMDDVVVIPIEEVIEDNVERV